MHPYLVGAAGFQLQLHEGHIAKTLKYGIVGDGLLAVFTFGVGGEYFPETLMAAYMCDDRSRIFRDIAPYESYVPAVYGVFLELCGQMAHCRFCFFNDHET